MRCNTKDRSSPRRALALKSLLRKPASPRSTSLEGAIPYDRLGYSIATLPDLDGDGIGDILAGAPNRDPNNPKHGTAYVISGATGKVLRVHAGVNYGDRFGRATSSIADLNGDGVPEYVIGATWGRVRSAHPAPISPEL